MKDRHFWVLVCTAAFLALLVLTGCATIATPQSFDQRLAYAAGTTTATRWSCADAYQRQRIDQPAAAQCLALTDHAMRTISAARLLSGAGDAGSAQAQLDLALGLLLEVERMLKAQVKP